MLSGIEIELLRVIKAKLEQDESNSAFMLEHLDLENLVKLVDRLSIQLSKEKERTKILSLLVAELYGRIQKQENP